MTWTNIKAHVIHQNAMVEPSLAAEGITHTARKQTFWQNIHFTTKLKIENYESESSLWGENATSLATHLGFQGL